MTTTRTITPTLVEAITHFSRALRASGHRFDKLEPTIRRTDAALLRYLRTNGESRAGDIAVEYGIDASVVSRQMGCLVASGHVARRPDPADARASLLTITESGDDRLGEFDRLYAEYLADRFSDWDDERLMASAAEIDAVATRLLSHNYSDEKDA